MGDGEDTGLNFKQLFTYFMLSWIWIGATLATDSGQTESTLGPDWLNPYQADRPEWDPYGPDGESDYVPGEPSWDPYGPSSYGPPQLVSSDPFSSGLTMAENVLMPNQLYLQSGGVLTTKGSVNLGNPYVLWLYVSQWGPFALYDKGSLVVSQSFMTPGWYKVGQYAEILESHLYQFNATLWSNEVALAVNSGGYPTSYSLTGRVVDPNGNGIPGAKVKISGSGGGNFGTITNFGGYYGISIPSGTYSVTAELAGYSFTRSTARVWVGTVSVAGTVIGYPAGQYPSQGQSQDQYPPDGQVTQQGVGWLEGYIADKSGTPIFGARIYSDGTSALSDSQGFYRIALSPGGYSTNVEATGYTFRPATVQIYPNRVTKQDFEGRKVLVLGGLR